MDPHLRGWLVTFSDEALLPSERILGWGADSSIDIELWPTLMHPRSDAKVVHSMFRLLEEASRALESAPESWLVLCHVLHALLYGLAATYAIEPTPTTAPSAMIALVRRFRRMVAAEFTARKRVSDFASQLGCSEKTLSRACRQVLGETPKALLDQRTALEAQRLVLHTSLTVSAIAAHLGFSEPTNFLKFFRRETGLTPTRLRQEALGAPREGRA